MLNKIEKERYHRQVLLPEIGENGQQKLLSAKVLVIGAGGLGCPVLQYLVAAGVGTIGVIDDDVVSLSNLHRQVLFGTNDVGEPKVTTAFRSLHALNNQTQFRLYNYRLSAKNAWNVLSDYDLVVDGSDNFSTRYLVNDACVLLKKPLVYGSISRFEGQVAFFNVNGSANYRHIFPVPPAEGEVADCSTAGVIGVLPGIIGSLMANEAIKWITQTGDLLTNQLLTYHSLSNTFYKLSINPLVKEDQQNSPQNRKALEELDYALTCSADDRVKEIEPHEMDGWIGKEDISIIDVREKGEWPPVDEFEHLHIPLSVIKENPPKANSPIVVIFCQSGMRSREAAKILRNHYPQAVQLFSVKGGIVAWKARNAKKMKTL